MTRRAAEVADGLLVMPFNSTRHFAERALPAVTEGLHRSGREPSEFQVIAQAMVAVAGTEEGLAKAIDRAASLIAFYGSTPNYRTVLEIEGWADVQPRLNELSKSGGYAEMRALITDEMVRTYGIVGTPEQCAEEIHERFGVRASDGCCYFPGYKPSGDDIGDLIAAVQRLPDKSTALPR